jgi:BirA family biotin operon repressor/biotin-[acetyl-CoA-carboxylase] ligase
MSAVVEEVPVDVRGRLALLAGVAVAEALSEPCTFFSEDDATGAPASRDIRLRWPNDLMLGDKKVGGVLCESMAQGSRFAAIIGVGLNVTTDPGTFPEGLRDRATSLVAYDGRLRTVTGVLDALLGCLAREFAGLATGGLAGMIQRARALDGLLNRRVELDTQGRAVEGVAVGLSDAGELLVKAGERQVAVEIGTVVRVDGTAVRG